MVHQNAGKITGRFSFIATFAPGFMKHLKGQLVGMDTHPFRTVGPQDTEQFNAFGPYSRAVITSTSVTEGYFYEEVELSKNMHYYTICNMLLLENYLRSTKNWSSNKRTSGPQRLGDIIVY